MLITPDYNPTASLKGVGLLIMDAKSADETKSIVVCPSPGIRNHTFDVIGNLAVAGVGLTGKLALESSSDPAGAEDWSLLGGAAIDLSLLTPSVAATKVRQAFTFSNIILTVVRGRIDVVVAGGTVSLVYTGGD